MFNLEVEFRCFKNCITAIKGSAMVVFLHLLAAMKHKNLFMNVGLYLLLTVEEVKSGGTCFISILLKTHSFA